MLPLRPKLCSLVLVCLIPSHLEQMSTNFNGAQNDGMKEGGNGNHQQPKQDMCQGLKGHGISGAGPFNGESLQLNVTGVMGGATMSIIVRTSRAKTDKFDRGGYFDVSSL